MATKPYRLYPAAEADLETIWFYTFKTWSQAQADRYHNSLVVEIETLASGLSKGRPAAHPGVLKRSCGSHVIYYRDLPDCLEIIRILHSAQDVERHLHD
jgi:toxin ParE1/3/4